MTKVRNTCNTILTATTVFIGLWTLMPTFEKEGGLYELIYAYITRKW